MQSSMLRHITEDFGNGGTIDGDLTITGDLQVDGGGSLSFDEIIEGTQVIDVTDTEALLVRKNSDGGDIFTVDTTNSTVKVGGDATMIKAGGVSFVIGSSNAGGASISLDGDSNGDGAGADYSYISHDTAGILNIVQDSPSGTNEIRFGTAGTEDKITIDTSGNLIVGSDGSGADVTFYSATAGDSFVWDASEEKLTITGTNGQTALDVADGNLVVADNVDIEGDIDVNGTSNLDDVDIDGDVDISGSITNAAWTGDVIASAYLDSDTAHLSGTQTFTGNKTFSGTLTVGSDGSGQDVTFYSGTSGDSFVWDSSEEKLTITGTNGQTALDVADGNLVVADNVDIEGDIDVNGTSNLDNTNIDGTLVVDGSNVSLDSTTTLNIDNSNTSNGITIGTATSGVPISIGHATSETTVNDNLVVTGDIDLEGSIDVNGTTNLDDVDIDGDVDISGSITNAAWTGDVIASAYLDADTAHLSGSQTFSGAKSFSEVVDITNTTDASDDSGDTGALRVEGGASIAKKLYVGGSVSLENGLDVSAVTTLKYETNSMTLTRDGGHLVVLRNSGSAIADGEALGYYRFNGKVGANDEEVGVSIQAEADGAWTADTDCPARLEFHTNSGSSLTERMRIDKDGVITLHQGQLKFPATQNASADAQTLDDYEEGSWTPSVAEYSTSGNAMTMSSDNIGRYTKIGDLVTCTAYVATTANGSATNVHIGIHSLPFTVMNNLAGRSGLSIGEHYNLNINSGKQIGGQVISNTTKIYLLERNESDYSTLTRDEWSTNGILSFSVTYKVA